MRGKYDCGELGCVFSMYSCRHRAEKTTPTARKHGLEINCEGSANVRMGGGRGRRGSLQVVEEEEREERFPPGG